MSAFTVATPFWMFTGKPLPIPAVAPWTAWTAAFVLQRLHQAGDLLPEAGELRHAAELGRAARRRRHPQTAEDQAHDER